MNEKKNITKKGYRRLIYLILAVGLITNSIAGTKFIGSGVTESQMRLGFWMAISLLVTGFGVGLAYSRMWKIEGVDN